MRASSDELLAVFGAEATEALELLCHEALALDVMTDAEDRAARIAAMFRAAHSLKGSAHLVGLSQLSEVAHALEDVLGDLRAGAIAVGPDLVTLVLRAVDLLGGLLPGALAGADQPDATAAAVAEIVSIAGSLRRPGAPPAVPPHGGPERSEPPATSSGPETAGLRDSSTPTLDTVKVPVARLETIGRLVGEALAARLGLKGRVPEGELENGATAAFTELGRVLEELDREARRARMVAFGTVAAPLQRAARDVAMSSGKDLDWNLDGDQTQLDRQVLETLRDPLLHLVRNAVDHGLEPSEERLAAGKSAAGRVSLSAQTRGEQVIVTVSDDGRGIDASAVADAARQIGVEGDPASLIFRQGLSTAGAVTEVSGRGVGLDIVQEAVQRLRGHVAVRSQPGAGATFELTMPLSIASLRCLIVRIGAERYALPIHVAARILDEAADLIRFIEGERAIELDGTLHPLHDLGELLGSPAGSASGPVVIVGVGGATHAIRVDELQGQRDVVVKDLSRLLGASRAIAGATVEPDGTVMLVLEPAGIVELAHGGRRSSESVSRAPPAAGPAPTQEGPNRAPTGPRVLVVDDALTVRELQRSILTRGGYVVETATDGLDAIASLGRRRPDVVISDVEMPRMDGFALTESIREHPTLSTLPVILLTSLGDDEHRRRGLEAGADAYLAKDTFTEIHLLQAVEQVLGGVP